MSGPSYGPSYAHILLVVVSFLLPPRSSSLSKGTAHSSTFRLHRTDLKKEVNFPRRQNNHRVRYKNALHQSTLLVTSLSVSPPQTTIRSARRQSYSCLVRSGLSVMGSPSMEIEARAGKARAGGSATRGANIRRIG